MQGWARDVAEGCVLTVRVTPGASRPGVALTAAGVAVRVQAPPVEGRATREAAERLAEALGVPKTAVRLRRGASSRDKAFEVRGMSAAEAADRLRGA